MANRKLSCPNAIRWFKCKLKPPKKVYIFDCLWANFIFELIVCIEKS